MRQEQPVVEKRSRTGPQSPPIPFPFNSQRLGRHPHGRRVPRLTSLLCVGGVFCLLALSSGAAGAWSTSGVWTNGYKAESGGGPCSGWNNWGEYLPQTSRYQYYTGEIFAYANVSATSDYFCTTNTATRDLSLGLFGSYAFNPTTSGSYSVTWTFSVTLFAFLYSTPCFGSETASLQFNGTVWNGTSNTLVPAYTSPSFKPISVSSSNESCYDSGQATWAWWSSTWSGKTISFSEAVHMYAGVEYVFGGGTALDVYAAGTEFCGCNSEAVIDFENDGEATLESVSVT